MSSTNNEDAGGQEDSREETPFDSDYISQKELDALIEGFKNSQSSESNIDEDRQKISDEFKQFKKIAEERFSDIETLTKAILFVGLISLVGVIVALMAIVVEQMHFNNNTYSQQKSVSQQQIELLKEQVQELKSK